MPNFYPGSPLHYTHFGLASGFNGKKWYPKLEQYVKYMKLLGKYERSRMDPCFLSSGGVLATVKQTIISRAYCLNWFLYKFSEPVPSQDIHFIPLYNNGFFSNVLLLLQKFPFFSGSLTISLNAFSMAPTTKLSWETAFSI